MTTLRSLTIRLAHAHPELRPHLLPVLKRGSSKPVTVQGLIKGYPYAEDRELNMIGPELDAKKYTAAMIAALTVPVKDADTGEMVKPDPTYNKYDALKVGRWAMKIESLFPGVSFIPGREYSVVLYLKAHAAAMLAIYKAAGRLGADEQGIYTSPTPSGQYVDPKRLSLMEGPVYLRLWWD